MRVISHPTFHTVGTSHQRACKRRQAIPESNDAGVIDGLSDDWFDRLIMEADQIYGEGDADYFQRGMSIDWWESIRDQAISNTCHSISCGSDHRGSVDCKRDLFHEPLTAEEFATRPFLKRHRFGDEGLRLGLIDPENGQRYSHSRVFEATEKDRFLLLRLTIYAVGLDREDLSLRLWSEGLSVVPPAK